MKILIVDDSLTVRKIVTSFLRKHHYDEIDEAIDGEEAIECLKAHEYGCIFLDINMPKVDGFGVLDWLRKNDLNSMLHVVVMSTEVMQFSPTKIQELGIHTVIPKPFTGNEFEKVAISLLNVISSDSDPLANVYDRPILIIDDSLSMRNIIRKQLTNLNCLNVDEATNGKEGIEKISELAMLYEEDETIGIVFLDLIMPVMDGLELIEMLEEKQLLSKLKIILLSGNVEMGLSMVDGVSIVGALPKPFEHDAFVNALKPLLQSDQEIFRLEEGISYSLFFDTVNVDVKMVDSQSICAQTIDEFCDLLFEPFESMALEISYPKEFSREIPKGIFDTLIDQVYRDVLALDNTILTYQELEYLYEKILYCDRLLGEMNTIPYEEIQTYSKTNLIPKHPDFIELETKINRYKVAIKTLIERKNKLAVRYKTSPSKELKEAYQKQEQDLLTYKSALEAQETTSIELLSNLEIDVMEQYEKRFEEEMSRIQLCGDQLRARFDRLVWEGMRDSERFRKYCHVHGYQVEFSSESWLKHEEKSYSESTKQFFDTNFNSSILIVGFKDIDGVAVREELTKLFPAFDIQSFSYWSIQNYSIPYVPSLLIVNKDSKELDVLAYLESVAHRFEIPLESLNILVVYQGNIRSEELLCANSIYNLKRKNYLKFPKNKNEYLLMGVKIKSLIF